jgi:hypothetical protein
MDRRPQIERRTQMFTVFMTAFRRLIDFYMSQMEDATTEEEMEIYTQMRGTIALWLMTLDLWDAETEQEADNGR